MNRKLQVFVSSTYTDLIEERQAAVQAILDAGHIIKNRHRCNWNGKTVKAMQHLLRQILYFAETSEICLL